MQANTSQRCSKRRTALSEEISFCSRCGCPLPNDVNHDKAADCIRTLRASLKRQAQASENLSFEVSTRLLLILESLAHKPSIAGVSFYCFDSETGKKFEIKGNTVAGVMTAIFREYERAGDWSPFREAKEEAGKYNGHAFALFSVLTDLADSGCIEFGEGRTAKSRLDEILHLAKEDGCHKLYPPRS